VIDIACGLADSGVHLVDLTLGEDPLIHDTGEYSLLFNLIDRIKKTTGLPVMISSGVVPDDTLQEFGALKTDWYALYQETHNPELFKKLRIGQSFEERSAKRAFAGLSGILVEDGILLGVGETVYDRADSILAMQRNNASQARVMSFVPQPQTPLASRPGPSRMIEYLCIAVMRLTMPDRLIPASLDVDGIKGLKRRLEAGANVVTSIIPPRNMLAGVSQSSLDIEQGLRTVSEVKKILADIGLHAGRAEDYATWITARKKTILAAQKGWDEPVYLSRINQSALGIPRCRTQ
jgi:methylornithine synthase